MEPQLAPSPVIVAERLRPLYSVSLKLKCENASRCVIVIPCGAIVK